MGFQRQVDGAPPHLLGEAAALRRAYPDRPSTSSRISMVIVPVLPV
jgi:hypothetical protein